MNNRIRYLTRGAVIAALYAVLTLVTWHFSTMAIQCRVSESLCVLYAILPEAVPGIFVGCIIANMFSGTLVDIVLGSLVTLAAGLITRRISKKISKRRRWLIPLPTVLCNTILIPIVLMYGYGIKEFGGVTTTFGVYGMLALSIFLGEMIACYGIGMLLILFLEKIQFRKYIE